MAITTREGRAHVDSVVSTHVNDPTSATRAAVVEAAQDAVAAMLVSGANVTLAYNDAGNVLTVTASGGDAELMRDTIGAALVGINGVSVAVNDGADTITLSVGGLTIAQTTGLQAALDAKASGADLTAHLTDPTDAHDASAISYAGSAGLSSVDVEAALDELDAEKPSWETSQRVVYVSPTGSDATGNGTSGAPWATIQYAVNQAKSIMQAYNGPSGYKVLVAPGTYVETVVVPPNTLAGLDIGLGGGLHIESTTGVLTDVIVRATGAYAVLGFGIFTLRFLTLEADTYGVVALGGRHVTGYVRDCKVRRTSLSDGDQSTRAIQTWFSTVISRDVSSEAGRLFGYGLRTESGGLIAKQGAQPTGAVANESALNGGVIR